ncbi:MAG: carbonic anhydrase [Bacillota bacterium]
MGSWEKSLDDLMAGNERFVSGELKADRMDAVSRCKLLEVGQHPGAIIICTSDAYMPPELIFDAELGDQYVIRLPDLEIDRMVLEGVEYAVDKLKTPLCMILTHEDRPGDPQEDEGFSFFRRRDEGADELIKNAVEKVRNSGALEEVLERGEFLVVGAKYDLETGVVTVFDF